MKKTIITGILLFSCILNGCASSSPPVESISQGENENILSLKKNSPFTVLAAPEYPSPYTDDDFMNARDNLDALYPAENYSNAVVDFISRNSSAVLQYLGKETPDSNSAYSSVSLYLSLCMTAEAADSETRQQILNYMGIDRIETLREQTKLLYRNMLIDDEFSKLSLSNLLWINNEFSPTLKQDCLNTLSGNYYTELYGADFSSDEAAKQIADQINKRTNNLLNVTPESLKLDPRQILQLFNTIYFTSEWVDCFNEELTKPDTFYVNDNQNVTCDFMNMEQTGSFYTGKNCTVVSLPLKSGSAHFILPDNGVAPETLLNQDFVSSCIYLDENLYKHHNGTITLQIPKFAADNSLSLKSVLEQAGVSDLFHSDKADFTPLTESESWISDIIQKTHLSINEKGAEAAAYTQIPLSGAEAPPEEIENLNFILNRPFIMILTSGSHPVVPIFTAVIHNPALNN